MVTTRAGNVIGGGDWADNRIVPDCIKAWSKGESVLVRSLQATRPWQHVLEPLSGYLWLGACLWQQLEGLNGEAFNFGPDAHVNQTVAELLGAMAPRWTGATWQVASGCDQGSKEATLLKLSCDKALFHLNWRAVLQFPETVAFTVDWYRTWHENRQDMHAYTVDQINSYCELGQVRGVPWIRT
jgi:CDP-glucose 4,6-dehydratase